MNETSDTDRISPRRRAAAALRKLSLAAADGDFLGAESELLEMLGVSRPTFRQAARLVAHDQLLEIRMGPRGGCYARRPNSDSVVRSAATFLHLNEATLLDALRVSCELECFAATLACANRDKSAAAELESFVETMRLDIPHSQDWTDNAEYRFRQLVQEMSGNPILALMRDVVTRFVAIDQAALVLRGTAPMVRSRRKTILRQGQAILAGDVHGAIELIRQQFDTYAALIPAQALGQRLPIEPLASAASYSRA